MVKERGRGSIASVFARQYGLITREQALRAGLTEGTIRRRIRDRDWSPIHRGVYVLAGSPPSWRRELLGACLACGAGAAASMSAASRLWGLPSFVGPDIEVSVDGNACRCRTFTAHRVFLPTVDVTAVERIPVTTPARTLIDIAAVFPDTVVEEALDDALRRRLVTRSRLRWRLNPLAAKGRPGVGLIRALLEERPDGLSVPMSVFETRLFRELRRANLPLPTRQHEIRDGGSLIAVADFAYPEALLVIEADSYRWHSGRARWAADLARRNRLTVLGWDVLHITWAQLTRFGPVANALRTMLAERISARTSRARQP